MLLDQFCCSNCFVKLLNCCEFYYRFRLLLLCLDHAVKYVYENVVHVVCALLSFVLFVPDD